MKDSTHPTDAGCTGALNVALGFAGLAVAALGGLALGATFDQYAVRNGDHVLSLTRFFLREGHSHGMPIALYNLVLGLSLAHWIEGAMARKVASLGAALGFLLPIGLVLRVLVGPQLALVGMLGALGLTVSFLLGLSATWRRACKR